MTRRRSSLTAEGPESPVAAPEQLSVASEPAPPPSAPAEIAAPVEGADVLECDASLLGSLSIPCTLTCRLGGTRFIITTSRAVYAQALVDGVPAFTGRELSRLAVAASMDRAFPAQLGAWLDRKGAEPAWTLSWDDAIGLPTTPADPERWTIGQTFVRLGVTLESVTMEG